MAGARMRGASFEEPESLLPPEGPVGREGGRLYVPHRSVVGFDGWSREGAVGSEDSAASVSDTTDSFSFSMSGRRRPQPSFVSAPRFRGVSRSGGY